VAVAQMVKKMNYFLEKIEMAQKIGKKSRISDWKTLKNYVESSLNYDFFP
jgi:hypothetical protein